MNIDISSIKNNIGEKINISIKIPKDEIDLLVDTDIIVNSKLIFEGEAVNIGKSILITGKIKITVIFHCDRCLDTYIKKYSITYTENFYFDSNNEEKINFNIIDDKIELWNSVRNEILLAIPMKKLCNTNCEGICQICGINLNKNSCQCKQEEIDPRLLVLKDLKIYENVDE